PADNDRIWSRCSRSTQSWNSPGVSPVSSPRSNIATTTTLTFMRVGGVGVVCAPRMPEIYPANISATTKLITTLRMAVIDIFQASPASDPTQSILRVTRRVHGLTNPCITRLDGRIDEITALVVRQKCTLHRVDGDLLEVVQRQAKSICRGLELPGHAGAAHQPVVGVEGDAKLLLIKNLEGMLSQAGRGAGMDVADEANFQWNSFV